MPRFYIDTFDGSATVDEDGHDLPSEAAARALVHRSLVAMAAEEATTRPSSQLRAEVRDEAGRRIMTAQVSVSVSVEWTAEANAEDALV
ncbi:hypothetical protein BV511_07505 [Methylorubrum extorquens]|uniref:DUF6894 family protein n=1 Tax=Methylorubrum extorquens TaxID=408 RepID=UPI0009727FFB|nr:hypothetical protein BV511_07505 [Methylorubrum extorquens]